MDRTEGVDITKVFDPRAMLSHTAKTTGLNSKLIGQIVGQRADQMSSIDPYAASRRCGVFLEKMREDWQRDLLSITWLRMACESIIHESGSIERVWSRNAIDPETGQRGAYVKEIPAVEKKFCFREDCEEQHL